MGGALEDTKRFTLLSGSSVALALLQSLCTAVLTINGVRVGIGLAALAAGSIPALAESFHRDAIRIPMLAIAVTGAVVNLLVLAWVRHLRARPESQWRRREPTKEQRRSEQLQIALAVLTLILVALEVWTHWILHRPNPATAFSASSNILDAKLCRPMHLDLANSEFRVARVPAQAAGEGDH
jgi:MFS family permease